MFRQMMVVAWRHLLNKKVFSLINIFGLIIGFSTFCLIGMFVVYEFSWDKHNTNYDRIYRIQLEMVHGDKSDYTASIPSAPRYNVFPQISGIEQTALVRRTSGHNENPGEFISTRHDNPIFEDKGYYSEQSLLDIFTFDLVEGRKDEALTQPGSIMLSETLAKKLFAENPAVGKQILIEKKHELTVTAVYKDLPFNSHFRPAYLTSFENFDDITGWKGIEENWVACGFNTYILLAENADINYINSRIKNCLEGKIDFFYLFTRPLSRLHDSPFFSNDLYLIYSLLVIAAFCILLLASLNFINLQTIGASTRLKEIGMIKVLGGSRSIVRLRFIAETITITLVAAILGMALSQVTVPFFNRVANFNLDLNLFSNYWLPTIIIIVAVVTGFLAGFYPGFILSSLKIVDTLQQKCLGKKNGFNRILVGFQLFVSLFLLIVCTIISKQAEYSITKDLGFNREGILTASLKTDGKTDVESVKNRLLSRPEIESVSFNLFPPYALTGGAEINWEGNPNEHFFARRNRIDYDYISTFDIELIMGRNFSKEYPGDKSGSCIVNEALVRQMGVKNPIGKRIWDNKYTIIGVVKDYNSRSLFVEIEPCILRLVNFGETEGTYSIRYTNGNRDAALATIKDEFASSYPNDAFEFQDYTTIFEAESDFSIWNSFKRIFEFFTVINIFVALMGLFGLVLFNTKQRTKEIGIRKILGCPVFNIYKILLKDILWLMGIATPIAFIAAYFVYKILPAVYKFDLSATIFLMPLLIVLAMVTATVSWQMNRAASANPVDALKYE